MVFLASNLSCNIFMESRRYNNLINPSSYCSFTIKLSHRKRDGVRRGLFFLIESGYNISLIRLLFINKRLWLFPVIQGRLHFKKSRPVNFFVMSLINDIPTNAVIQKKVYISDNSLDSCFLRNDLNCGYIFIITKKNYSKKNLKSNISYLINESYMFEIYYGSGNK
jgi:hypothetical protein